MNNQEKIKKLINSFKSEEYFDFVNLHIHSKYSDGNADFEDIINQAKQFHFQKIAICDHNTIEGHLKFKDKILIPAVEFDCWYKYIFLHIIAYGIDVRNPILHKFYAKSKRETEMDIFRIFARRNVRRLIDSIHQAGGVAVLAHPACCWAINLDEFVSDLVKLGLDGIEVYYPYNRHRKIFKFHDENSIESIADKYSLLKTGGTDCHGRDILQSK